MNDMVDTRQVVANLANLENAPRGKLGRKALRAGMQKFAAAARGVAPGSKIRSAIKVRAMRRSRSRIGMMVIISDSFAGDFYDSFVELGHKIGRRPTTAKGRREDPRTGFVRGTHWEGREFRSTRGAILQTIGETIRDGLQDAVTGGGAGD